MNIKITDGLNIVSIGYNRLGSYFRLKRPVSIVWDECAGGGDGMYLSLIPSSAVEREMLQRTINVNLFEDFTGREAEAYVQLKPLFGLLQNGNYQLYFNNGKNKREAVVFSGGKSSTYEIEWDIAYAESVDLSKIEEIKKNYKKGLRDTGNVCYNEDLIGYTTASIYGDTDEYSIATRPRSEIDPRKVDYFMEKIQKGERPFIIMMSAIVYPGEGDFETEDSAYFILDGHHKLEAYIKLNINPPCLCITQEFTSPEQPEFDVESLSSLLYPWQTRHILDNLE